MGKLVEDAQAVADSVQNLLSDAIEAEGEQGGSTVSDKTVTKVTVTYSDGSSVDFTSGDTAAAPVVSPVTSTPVDSGEAPTVDTPDTPTTAEDSTPTANEPVPEGGTEVPPTIAGVVPGQS